jgi:hypothetical protein
MKAEIRSIVNTRISLSKEELEYYEKLKNMFGEESFRGLFQTDLAGHIAAISPPSGKATPNPVLFFLLNVSFNQRMRQVEKYLQKIEGLEERIKKLESKTL